MADVGRDARRLEYEQKVLAENENVMITCGRMGPMCLPVYDVMESLECAACGLCELICPEFAVKVEQLEPAEVDRAS